MEILQKIHTPYSITLDTEINLTGATSLRVYYKKPISGETGELIATASGTSLVATVTADINNEDGEWLFEGGAILSNETAITYGLTFAITVLPRFSK